MYTLPPWSSGTSITDVIIGFHEFDHQGFGEIGELVTDTHPTD